MTTPLRSAYQFMREHAGYIVGRNAEGALNLARAEALLGDALDLGVATVEWEHDPETYDPGDFYTAEQVAAKFDSNEWTGPFYCVVKTGDDVASLSGIVVGQRGTNDPYCRVVTAELASELLDALRQAIGDARDEELPHVGHFSRLGGTWHCDTCDSPYCDLA